MSPTHPHLEGLIRIEQEFDDGLEDMELAGMHDAPGYRKLKAAHAKLQAALAALPGGGVDAQDAARYRWLRQFDIGINHLGYGDYEHHAYADENINFGRWSLDRVIDAHLTPTPPPPHEADRNG